MCGSVGVGGDDGGNEHSVCLNVAPGGDVVTDVKRIFSGEETDRILREELGSTNIISTPKRAAWPLYTRRRSSVLSEQEPLCKAVMFDSASGSGTVGGGGLPTANVTDSSGGVAESYVTSGRFSILEGIAQRQAGGRFAGTLMGDEGEGMVRIPPVDKIFVERTTTKERQNIILVSRRKVC